jgi:hypothetical protein
LLFPSGVLVVFEDVLEIFVEADFQKAFLEECAFDILVDLVVVVFPNDIGQFEGGIGVHVFLFFNHDSKLTVRLYIRLPKYGSQLKQGQSAWTPHR